MSKIERVLRVIVALGIFAAGFYFTSWWALIGIIPLITGIAGVCPLYVYFGKQACPLGVCPISKKAKK